MNNKIYLIFNEKDILIKPSQEKINFLNDSDIKELNLVVENISTLLIKDDVEFIVGELSKFCNLPSDFKFLNLRVLSGTTDEETFHLVAKAFHLMNWNKTNQYCTNCGSTVENKKDERAKICPNCGYISYPTICPAIITAVIKDGKLLLAHNTNFPKDLFSVIAGFVEPGESFEDCVKREVFEEIGIKVKNIKYFGSQPWPFPYSLMVAFVCEYESGEITVDKVEIDKAAWYTVSKIPDIPSKGSISRKLIDFFIENYK